VDPSPPIQPLSAALASQSALSWQVTSGAGRLLATAGKENDEPQVSVEVRYEDARTCASVWVGGGPGLGVGQMAGILEALLSAATPLGSKVFELDTTHDVSRHAARRRGFAGPLRGVLQLGLPPQPVSRTDASKREAQSLGGAVADLVGHLSVTAKTARGLRRLAQAAVSGLGPMLDLEILGGGNSAFSVSVPARADVMAESVAMAVDTAAAIRTRFPTPLDHVRRVCFGHHGHEMVQGRVAGQAAMGGSQIEINAAYCCADLAATLAERRGNWRPRLPSGAARSAYRVDNVMAHELGHHLDFWFQGQRYRDSIDFRRELGEELGVSTLEHAILGREKSASPGARAAWETLVGDVSAYSTASIQEAMAELFALWWFAGSDGPPIVRRFGSLLGAYGLDR